MGDFTGFLLNWVAGRSRAAFTAQLDARGLRPQHFMTMVMLDASPGLAQQELVTATHIDPSTMVALVDDLERAGLAERRPHASDRRKHSVHLTDAGQATLEAALAEVNGPQSEVFAAIEPAELAELHRILRKLAGYAS